jgi:hypothetical protein
VIVTSQVDPRGWLKLFEDAFVGEAIVDRLPYPSDASCSKEARIKSASQRSPPERRYAPKLTTAKLGPRWAAFLNQIS